MTIWGAIKKFSASPSSVQNKIKIVLASYGSKAQNTTCTIWLLGYNYFVHFSGHRLFVFDMEKPVLSSIMKWQFWPIRSFHCMLCCSNSESKLWMHVSSWITSCDINFCWVTSVSFKKFLYSLVLAFSTPIWQTLCYCLYAKMHKIFIAQKSYCAYRLLRLATIRSK